MQPSKALFAEVVVDLAMLRDAYRSAGLLNTDNKTNMANSLLGGDDGLNRFAREFLLADAIVRNRVARLVIDSGKLSHVAVFGGNNVGKSTVINMLAAGEVAVSSPEGGQTQHAHAFTAAAPPLFGQNTYCFRDFSLVEPGALNKSRHDQYTVTTMPPKAVPDDVVLWDAPDCDAVGSYRYLATVIEACAAADVVVYVTGLGNYSSAHIVEWVFRLHDAGIPIVECLNRAEKQHRARIIERQRTFVFPEAAKHLDIAAPDLTVIPLRFLSGDDAKESDLWGPQHPEAAQLRATVIAQLKSVDRPESGRKALEYILRRIGHILKPARMEVAARRTWNDIVNRELAKFVAAYDETYLKSKGGKTIEPFTRVNLEILNFLDPDIRGLKETVATLRWVSRLPVRIVLWGARTIYEFAVSGETNRPQDPVAPQVEAYTEANKKLIQGLARELKAQRDAAEHHPFWDRLDTAWQDQLESLQGDFARQVIEHRQITEAEIKEAAKDIFERLKSQPVLLNTLRTVKVGVTFGSLAVTYATLGHGSVLDLLGDLVITPAILTVTEGATMGAVATYIEMRRSELVDKLRRDALNIVEKVYYRKLIDLADKSMGEGSLGIDQDLIERLPVKLRNLQDEISRQPA
jgi:50S ribosome-binding GTPase